MSAVIADKMRAIRSGAAEGHIVDANSNSRPANFESIAQEILAVFGLCIAPGANSMGIGSPQLALPAIGRELQSTRGRISWVFTAFL